MVKRLLVLVSAVTAASAFLVFSTHEQGTPQGITQDEVYYNERGLSYFEVYYNERGLSYFNEGFYNLTPKGREAEASQAYEKAIAAFKVAVAINGTYVDAHRNLARVYYVQKRFSEAAQEYKRVTELVPYDVDVYVKLASAYGKLRQYSEAIEQLEKAKTFTSEKVVLNRLNAFIKRLEQKE